MGADNKVSGNKITGIKILKKKVLNLVKMRSSLRRFYKKDFFLSFISIALFCKVVNILCSHHFLLKQDFFPGTFLYKIILEPEKKVLKNKVSKRKDFIPKTFYFMEFFPQDFFNAKIQDFISENFFSQNFFGSYPFGIDNILYK